MTVHEYQILIFMHLGETEVWELEDELECFEGGCENQDVDHESRAYALTVWFVNLLALLQRKHYIPDTAINLFLKLLFIFLTLLSQLYPAMSEVVEVFHFIKCKPFSV